MHVITILQQCFVKNHVDMHDKYPVKSVMCHVHKINALEDFPWSIINAFIYLFLSTLVIFLFLFIAISLQFEERKRVASRRVAVRSLRARTAVRVVGSFYYQRTDSPGGRVVAHPLYAGHVHTARLQTVPSFRTGKNRIFRFFRPEKGQDESRSRFSNEVLLVSR